MQSINSRKARDTFSATLEQAIIEPLEVTRTGGKESVVMLSKREYEAMKRAQLEAEMDFILERHEHTFTALADR
ncbi:type II toxin-antitoxin system Phd/YefM family antitoxin [Salmonella enterica]|nr:type II toxin-antitoxin system Phd/YefM family antitoxin [Salmonella enterica]EKK6596286.1 type II toxin-antitoxin system Phd/YefM family antitoxin [Salmonella enterica]